MGDFSGDIYFTVRFDKNPLTTNDIIFEAVGDNEGARVNFVNPVSHAYTKAVREGHELVEVDGISVIEMDHGAIIDLIFDRHNICKPFGKEIELTFKYNARTKIVLTSNEYEHQTFQNGWLNVVYKQRDDGKDFTFGIYDPEHLTR